MRKKYNVEVRTRKHGRFDALLSRLIELKLIAYSALAMSVNHAYPNLSMVESVLVVVAVSVAAATVAFLSVKVFEKLGYGE